MAATKQLAAVARNGIGKGAARSVRREGRVPGVIYGGGEAPEPISVDYKDLNKLVYAGHFLTTIFELDLAGRKERVLPRDYQLDVVNDRPLHVDFLRLKAGSRVRIQTPVHVKNQELSPGIKKGGAVNLVLHSVELWAPADAIPEFDHHRSGRSRLPRFGASFDDHAPRRLQADQHQDRSDDRHDRAADRLTEDTPAPAAVATSGAPAAGAAAAPAPGAAPAKGAAAAAPAKGAAAAPAKAPAAKK